MLSDLYAGNDSMTKDFRTVVWRIKSLGFNAVRIGFNFDTLYQSGYDKPYNMRCNEASAGSLVASVTPPGGQGWSGSPPRIGGRCNEGIPEDSVYSRFLWACDYIASQGMYVMVDFHNSGKANQVGDLAFRDVESFINNWEKLVKDLKANPTVSGKLLIDLINEPDAYNIRWEAANGNPGLTDLYLRALDRLYPACPDCLFVIEGTGQSAAKANWGDGFITNQTTIKEFGGKVSDATPFFEAAVAKPWAKQAILSPHIYCPSSSKAIDGFRGQEMYDRLDNSFGSKIRAPGYCNADGVCHQFAAIVGETSNNFWTGGQNERDCWVREKRRVEIERDGERWRDGDGESPGFQPCPSGSHFGLCSPAAALDDEWTDVRVGAAGALSRLAVDGIREREREPHTQPPPYPLTPRPLSLLSELPGLLLRPRRLLRLLLLGLELQQRGHGRHRVLQQPARHRLVQDRLPPPAGAVRRKGALKGILFYERERKREGMRARVRAGV